MTSIFYKEIEEHVNNIRVVDTHEHMPTEEEWLAVDDDRLDFSQLMHYVDLDIVSAGMPPEDMRKVRFTDLNEDEKWTLFEPHWLNARNTSYARIVEMAVRDFYGVPGLNRDTYREIGRRIRGSRRHGRYKEVLKDTAGIEISLLDTGCANPDPELFVPVTRLDHFLWITGRKDLEALEEKAPGSTASLLKLRYSLGKAVEKVKTSGAAAVKTAQAYQRTLRYEYVTKEEAGEAFDRIAALEIADPVDVKILSDYLFYHMLEKCIDHDLPIQIHTGINAGNAVRLEPANPVFLEEVFIRYPEARFDLFHAGFPFYEELGVLVKTFPNTRADLCWTHMISPSASRRILDEWLELIPANKIFGFGGDSGSVEIAAAHLKIARANITRALAAKVEDGYFTLDEAKRIAGMILRDNPKEFFQLA